MWTHLQSTTLICLKYWSNHNCFLSNHVMDSPINSWVWGEVQFQTKEQSQIYSDYWSSRLLFHVSFPDVSSPWQPCRTSQWCEFKADNGNKVTGCKKTSTCFNSTVFRSPPHVPNQNSLQGLWNQGAVQHRNNLNVQTFDWGMGLGTYLTIITKKMAFLIRGTDELLQEVQDLLEEKGWNRLFPLEPLGMTLNFQWGRFVSESKPEPDSEVGHSPPLPHGRPSPAEGLHGLLLHSEFKAQSWILQPGIISDFPGVRTAIPFALRHLLVCFGERKKYLKKPQPVTIQKTATLSQQHSSLQSKEEDN